MSVQSAVPRLRTVVTLGCIVLVCVFYWDVIILNKLYKFRRAASASGLKDPSFGLSWECVEGDYGIKVCQKVMKEQSSSSMSLLSCQMTCSPGRNIWPTPTGEVRISNTTASFHPRNLNIEFEPVNNLDLAILLKKAAIRFQERIVNMATNSHARPTVMAFILEEMKWISDVGKAPKK
ncbi:uncharacterized protein LOC128997564 [Macrosteles quadrilineatus]|uniref:uncharacterized protein LOC128997564 n=1 Tax=Macrosteles quadrilineatus TaxID=74068 RepID=UPI0023E2AD89|nr:uncharacterized protein LOC128997564 [Macrosteles quadrilineatus]